MLEVKGNIWDYYDEGNWVVIPTNRTIKRNGEAVMGRGVALQAKLKRPDLPLFLGDLIRDFGNQVYRFDQWRLLSFPLKDNWWELAKLSLIEVSLVQLKQAVGFASGVRSRVYLPRVGCGNGGLDWKDVKPILERYLDDRFIVVLL